MYDGEVVGKVALGKLVDVNPLVTAQQVVDGLVVHALGILGLDTGSKFQFAVQLVGIEEIQGNLHQVVVTTFQNVLGATVGVHHVVGVVGAVHGIPVDLRNVGITGTPQVGQLVGQVFVHLSVVGVIYIVGTVHTQLIVLPAGQVAVVVGTGVGRIVERNGRVAVHAVVETQTGSQVAAVVDFPVPVEDSGGVVAVYDTRVAFLAVLIAPVGVVIDTAVVIDLLRYGSRLSPFGRSTEGCKGKPMIVEHLFGSKEVTERVVERTLGATLVGPAVNDRPGEGPAVIHDTGRVDGLSAQFVSTVGIGGVHVGTGGIAGGAGVDVGRSTQRTEGIARHLETVHSILVTHGVVQATQTRVVETTTLQVVEINPVDIGRRLPLLVTAHIEAHGAVGVAGSLQIDIVGGTRQIRSRLGSGAALFVEHRLVELEDVVFESLLVERCVGTFFVQRHIQGIDPFHDFIIYRMNLVVGRCKNDRHGSFSHIFQFEFTIEICNSRRFPYRHFYIRNRFVCFIVNDNASHRRGLHQGRYQKKQCHQ